MISCASEKKEFVSADIESMFSQVAIPDDDQTVLRFLWRENRDESPLTCSSFVDISLGRSHHRHLRTVLRQTAKDSQDEFPGAAETIFSNFYMDDLFKSEKDEDAAFETHVNLTKVLSRGGISTDMQ